MMDDTDGSHSDSSPFKIPFPRLPFPSREWSERNFNNHLLKPFIRRVLISMEAIKFAIRFIKGLGVGDECDVSD